MVLKRIIESMGCGTVVKPGDGRDRYNISVANISDLTNIVIPLFEKKNPIYGAKNQDFLDFLQRGVHIIKDKRHLTSEGLNELKILAYAMNTESFNVINYL